MVQEKESSLQFYKIASLNVNRVNFPNLEEFRTFIDRNHINEVFVIEYDTKGDYETDAGKIQGLTEFCSIKDSVAYCSPGYGYKSFEDVEESKSFGSYAKSSHYGLVSGKVKPTPGHRGYGFSEISDGFLFYYLKELGAKDYSEFEKYIKGFEERSSFEEFRKIVKEGFSDYESYRLFKDSGFDSPQEFEKARKVGFDNRKEYDKFKRVEEDLSKLGFKGVDQFALYKNILAQKKMKVEFSGTNVSNFLQAINESEFLDKLNNGYLIKGKREYYWDARSSDLDWKKIDRDLSTLPSFTSIGTYDPDRRVFFKFTDVIVYLDGSNVAWNNGSKEDGDKPSALNVKLVIEEIKKRNPKEIVIFCDANLKYEIDDKDVLENLRKKYDIRIVPAKTKADTYIIGFAEANKDVCVITSDTFGDYLTSHPKKVSYWNDHRIAFMIDKNGKVIFSMPEPFKNKSREYEDDYDDD